MLVEAHRLGAAIVALLIDQPVAPVGAGGAGRIGRPLGSDLDALDEGLGRPKLECELAALEALDIGGCGRGKAGERTDKSRQRGTDNSKHAQNSPFMDVPKGHARASLAKAQVWMWGRATRVNPIARSGGVERSQQVLVPAQMLGAQAGLLPRPICPLGLAP